MAELAAGRARAWSTTCWPSATSSATPFVYAGDSVGGAVGLQLLLDHPARVSAAVLLCTGAQIGDDTGGPARIEPGPRVRARRSLVGGAVERWFAPGFARPRPGHRVEPAARAAGRRRPSATSQVCEALAGFDVRDRLGEIGAPVLAVAGARRPRHDHASTLKADRGRRTRTVALVELTGVAHLAPAEAPDEVAAPDRAAPCSASPSDGGRRCHDAGMAVRREVLGDAHVDRAIAGTTDFTARLPGADHRLRLGQHLDPARPRPAQPLDRSR